MKRRKRGPPRIPKLPVPLTLLVFMPTERGVVRAIVIGDFVRRPFHKAAHGLFWTSWRPLTAAELRLVLEDR